MIKINLKQVKEMEARLGEMKSIAVPFAVRSTMNAAAFQAQTVARRGIKRNMILRNKFSVRSIQVEATKDLKRPEAVIGSVAKYMSDQEFGTTKSKKGKVGVPLTTSYASGEGQGTQPRKKLARKPNQLRNIMLRKSSRRRGKTRKQRNLIAVREAAGSTNKLVYLRTGRTKAIFRVLGGKRRPRLKMLYNLKHQSVRIPRNPWLRPAVLKVGKRLPQIHFLSLQFQFRKLRSL